ncbi:uncharacterized protein LOC142359281 [Opisthocomus hoazin]|uniref:uncharacterized protein LOC142359281 n=1 Tax=Opisthocomus hoazin TaxID=30419 RepID=UPI003F530431
MRGAAEQHGGGLVSGAGAAGEQRGQRWGTAKRPELRKRNGGEQDREASEAAESPGSAESESCGGGEPNDWSCGRRREERRGEKHLKCPSLLAAPRVRAAWPAPCSSFLAASAEQRVAPGGDGRTVRRWINGRSCGKECRGVGGAEGASGAPSPGAERLPGLAGGLHPAPHFWQPLPSSASLREPTDGLFPAGATGAAAGRSAEVSEGQRERRGWGP